ncbi:DNA polymerase catalytic subunit [Cervid alphaherpesvirus 1]|uniref:DNA polymerase n=2 Tax=Cervid alphaherpesvirus 1 TaxID=79891 RepID=A0A455JIQ3_9ALPH|nr:DNA polymerase catalytic subunit [Cervid alphaherpesvirus 1]AVT50679.1 DNA polymerase catalytic subunit [Cervid alphaherpesvirus 1]
MDRDCEQGAAPPRAGFFNPYLAPRGRGAPARPPAAGAGPDAGAGEAGGARGGGRAPESYRTAVSSFRFIAPRCLDGGGGDEDEDGAAARRRGVHIGTAERAPKVYLDGEEHDVLDFAGHRCWPRRVSVWAGRAAPERAALDPRFERFHVYDIVETTEYPSAGDASRFAAEGRPGGATVVTLLGMSEDGKRVAVHVYGVRHYFYMEKAAVDLACGVRDEGQLVDAMVAALRTSALAAGAAQPDADADAGAGARRAGRGYLGRASRDSFSVAVVSAADVYFYDTRPQLFYKVSSASARLGGYLCDNFLPGVTKYEGGVDATTRFLLDNEGFTSFGWYRLRPGRAGARVALRAPEQHATSCDVEVNCTADNLEPLAGAEADAWPDYKLLCFDIECLSCAGDGLAFPVAANAEDLVVQISCLTYSLRTQRHEHTLLFSLGSCDLPPAFLGACAAAGLPAPAVLEFDSEFELLLAFVTFLKQYSPEFVTGYNIVNFDWAYLSEKLAAVYDMRLDGYGKLNRGGLFRVFDAGQNRFQKQSKVKINGVVSLDMYRTAVEKLKLPSYKLNAVAEEALRERKVDLDYKDIPRHFAAGPEGRGVIGEYCIQDSALVGKLFFKYLPHLELSAVARLAGITMPRAIFDGQQIRVFTCLLRLARERGFLLPDNQKRLAGAADGAAAPGGDGGPFAGWADPARGEGADGEEEEDGAGEEGGEGAAGAGARPRAAGGRAVGYQGAKVLDPESGFHVDPVMVLDFASLYPSIIQAHNLCFTTLVRGEAPPAGLAPGADYATFAVGGRTLHFVRAHVRESLLSVLLRDWLAMRKAIRARIPAAAPEEAVLLDKQQAAIKVVCNSVYGFTGVANGLLPCLAVAATVTTIGRDMLLETRRYIHERWAAPEALARDFPAAAPAAAAAGARYRVRVVYGDTDSVFVKFAGMPYDAVCALGDGMARQVSAALFRPPIKLECEKTFAKLLLITKKKYLGLVAGGKMLMKGVDLVRKNNCRFINAYARRLVDVLMHDDAVSRAAAEASAVPPGEWPGRQLPPGFARFGAVLAEAHAKIADPALDLGDFVMTAELSRPPEAYANKRIAHLTVYYKLLLRSEARPSVKDRIPYVIVAPGEGVERDAAAVNALRGTAPPPAPPGGPAARPARLLVSDMAEDPGYARAHAVPLNTDYYFSHLLGTVGATFKALFGNDTRTTENLLKRFIPETRACDRRLQGRLAAAGFAALTPAAQSPQTLRTAFGILAEAPRRS